MAHGRAYGRPWPRLLALMVGVTLLMELLQSAVDWIRIAQSEFVRDYISALVHEKSVAVDIAFYESPEYHDHLYRVRGDAGSYPLTLLESVGSLLQNTITFLAMGSVLIPYGGWLPLMLLASTLPALYAVLRFNWRTYHGGSRRLKRGAGRCIMMRCLSIIMLLLNFGCSGWVLIFSRLIMPYADAFVLSTSS